MKRPEGILLVHLCHDDYSLFLLRKFGCWFVPVDKTLNLWKPQIGFQSSIPYGMAIAASLKFHWRLTRFELNDEGKCYK